MPEEVELKKPRKRGRKSLEEQKKITGLMNRDAFTLALSDIERDSLVSSSKVADILVSAMSQAYLEWAYPGLFKEKDNLDPAKQLIKCKVVFSDDISSFKIYDTKIVTEEDDIVDDAYQVSLEDAKEINPDAKLGDIIDIPFDVTQLNKSYVRRVKQLFQAKLKEASKQAITSVYSNQIGDLIYGKVINIERGEKNHVTYELSFGKANGFLHAKQLIPGDKFALGENVLVYLINVSDKSNPPSLAITRSSEKFVIKLFERAVPELADGTIEIKGIVREAGKRTKIFVSSNVPHVDPVGTCIGPESSRSKTVLNQLNNEKVDILKYHSNKALQILEAMKPAQLIGLTCLDDFFDPNVHFEEIEKDRGYEYPAVTAVVSTGNSGVAIGTGGVNVRLASKLTMCNISVKTADEAIKEKLKYMLTPDIEREANKLEGVSEAPAVTEVSEEVKDIETQAEEEAPFLEPITEFDKSSETVQKSDETMNVVEDVKADEKPVADETSAEQKPNPTSTTSEIKTQSQEIEHVEIKNKPKISLKELEQAMSQKKGPAETRSYKKHRRDEEKEETTSLAKNVQAMPIYTQEELEEIKAQELEDEENDYDYDDELEEYDSDSYYDEDNGK